jgi:hypothetical protein
MAGISLMSALSIADRLALKKIAAQTSHATGGTRKDIAHGLVDHTGTALTPSIAIVIPTATDVDHVTTGMVDAPIMVVKMDSTNVTVRCPLASQTFDLYVG